VVRSSVVADRSSFGSKSAASSSNAVDGASIAITCPGVCWQRHTWTLAASSTDCCSATSEVPAVFVHHYPTACITHVSIVEFVKYCRSNVCSRRSRICPATERSSSKPVAGSATGDAGLCSRAAGAVTADDRVISDSGISGVECCSTSSAAVAVKSLSSRTGDVVLSDCTTSSNDKFRSSATSTAATALAECLTARTGFRYTGD